MRTEGRAHFSTTHFWNVNSCRHSEQRQSKFVSAKEKTNGATSKLEELSSTVPGLKHVLDSRRGLVFKSLWILIIGCSFGLCFYQINNRLQLFISNPIESRLTILQNETVKFPSLTVCALEERYVPLIPIAQNISVCNDTFTDLLPEINISLLWSMMNTNGLIKNAAIIAQLNLVNNRHLEAFEMKSTLTFFGNCTTYSINELVHFRREDFKINIQFNQPPIDSFGSLLHSAMYLFHHDDEDVTYKFITESSYLSSEKLTIYGIVAKEFHVINRTAAPCDSIAVVSRCERRCIDYILRRRVTCRLPFMAFADIPLCKNSSDARIVLEDTRRTAIEIMYSKTCSCPRRCNEILYSKKLAVSNWCPHPVLEYHFDSNVIIDIQEYYSYPLVPFICDVGGNLGLFLGLCIPAIIDIIQNVIGYLFNRIIMTLGE